MNNISLSRAEREIIVAFGLASQSRADIDERTIQFCDRNHDAMQSLVSKNILTSTLAEHARLTKFGEMAFVRIRATERIQALINASRAKIIAIAVFLCLSANALFAQGLSQQHPDHPVNAPENLECVPGICVPRIELPRRDFMSTEQHQLTAPVRIAYIRRKADTKADNAVQFLYLHDDCNCDESRLHYDYDMIEPAQELE